jgi:hypothetical protein
MSLADRLFQKARHYETLAASYRERAPIEPRADEGALCPLQRSVVRSISCLLAWR